MIRGKESKGTDLIDILIQVGNKEHITGVLKAENPGSGIVSKVFIKDGQIVYATSTMYRARFGDLMIKKGIITPKELNTALRLQKENPRPTLIGSLLVEMGVISERVIPNLLYHQIEVVIYEILSWKTASVTLDECNIDEEPDYKRPVNDPHTKLLYSDLHKLIDTEAFVKNLEINLDSLIRIRNFLNNPEVIPKRIMKNYPSQLTFDQRKILRAIDGSNSLNDIIILSDLDYFRTYQILFDLFSEKVITIPGIDADRPEEEANSGGNENTGAGQLPDQHQHNSPETAQGDNKPFIAALQIGPEDLEKMPPETRQKCQQIMNSNREEIKQLRLKLNDYENSKLVLNEDITIRISKLPYRKKVMLNTILKNILDMVDRFE